MRADNDLCIVLKEILYRRQCAHDTALVGDNLVFVKGYVKIDPDKYALALYGNIFD